MELSFLIFYKDHRVWCPWVGPDQMGSDSQSTHKYLQVCTRKCTATALCGGESGEGPIQSGGGRIIQEGFLEEPTFPEC